MVELFNVLGKVKIFIIDLDESGYNCYMIKNWFYKNLIFGKNDGRKILEL